VELHEYYILVFILYHQELVFFVYFFWSACFFKVFWSTLITQNILCLWFNLRYHVI